MTVGMFVRACLSDNAEFCSCDVERVRVSSDSEWLGSVAELVVIEMSITSP